MSFRWISQHLYPWFYLYVGAAELKKRVDFELLMKLGCGNLIENADEWLKEDCKSPIFETQTWK